MVGAMQPCPRAPQEPHPFRFDTPHWRENGTCSYCGSMKPETLFQAIETGSRLIPTDKSYKVYVDGGDMRIAHGKFYFYHLDEAEQRRFIELMNSGKILMGAPGYFYTLPFFCKAAA